MMKQTTLPLPEIREYPLQQKSPAYFHGLVSDCPFAHNPYIHIQHRKEYKCTANPDGRYWPTATEDAPNSDAWRRGAIANELGPYYTPDTTNALRVSVYQNYRINQQRENS